MSWILPTLAIGGGILYLDKVQNELTDCKNNNLRLQDKVEELKEEIRNLQSQLKQKKD